MTKRFSACLSTILLISSLQTNARGPIGPSENTRQMSTALNASGKCVFIAFATKLNASNGVVVQDKNGNVVPFASDVAGLTLYHSFDKPLIFVKKPGSHSQYFLFTQASDGLNDFLYRHTLDASLPGNGSLEDPLGEIIETNYLVDANGDELRYGAAEQAVQNFGGANITWMYFLKSSDTQVQLTGRILNSNGSFGSSIAEAPVNGKAIGKIKFSSDGNELLIGYRPPAVLNQVQLSIIKRYGIRPNGALALLEEISLAKDLLEFEFSPDGRFIYYGLAISETPVGTGKLAARSGTKFQVRRWNLNSQADELIGESFNDEIFNGKHLAFQRSANGKIYISAAGHRRMMVINDPGSVKAPALSGEAIADNDPSKSPYLSGAFATVALDYHFHSIQSSGSFYASRNKRQYELKDHLENVNVVVSDQRSSDGSANVVSANNYYPYGMTMPGRNYNSADYRYGFNGKEKDDEIKGTGNSYDFGARLYDPRVGRWLTRDPLAAKYAGWSDYNAFADNPILYVDPDGRAPKEYLLTLVEYKIGTETMEASVLLVDGDDWKVRAKKIVQGRFAGAGVTEFEELGKLSIEQMANDWKVLNFDNSGGLVPLIIENEAYHDYKVYNEANDVAQERSRARRSKAGHLGRRALPRKWPRGQALNIASIADDILDGEKVDFQDAIDAAVTTAIPPIVDIVMLEADEPDFAADYNLNSRALESLRFQTPQCFDSWFNTFRVHSDYCNNRLEDEKEYVMNHPPGKHWFNVTSETVQSIIQRSKKE